MMVVVDTNVPKVANGLQESPQASPQCVRTCISRIRNIVRGKDKLVLDESGLILREYRRNLRTSGQPGTGDEFLHWILRTGGAMCEKIPITLVNGSEIEFEEFPDDPALKRFDVDDRKFVAVACAHPDKPPILQAVDSHWLNFHDALHQNGVTVEELCPEDVQRFRGAE